MSTAYVASHWSPDGQTSGYTIVVASCETMARFMVWNYLKGKPGGCTQCASSSCLEMHPLDETSLFDDLYFSLPLDGHGVKCEFRLDNEAPESAPLMVAYMPDEMSCLMFDQPGHPQEYELNVAGHYKDKHIPQVLSNKLQSLLPSFSVCNRGNRIEIAGKPLGLRHDDTVITAVKAVFGDNLNLEGL